MGEETRFELGQEARRTFERKSMPMVAWYMLSKESYMNLVIRDVFPTGVRVSDRSIMLQELPTALFSQKNQPAMHLERNLD